MSMLRLIIIAVVCVQGAVLQGCVFGPGPKCAFPCRCHDARGTGLVTSGGSCNPVTGGCPSGVCISQARTGAFVGQSWSGDGCQTGNVALGKTAFITNTGAEANNIVDGWIGSGYNCTSVDTGDIAAAVTVDLGGLYTITCVDVWNTHDSADCSRCKSGKCHPEQWCEQCVEGWTGHDCTTVEPLSVPTQASTLTSTSSTVALCNTTTTSYKLYTDNSPTPLQTNNNSPTTLSTNYHNPAPLTPSSTQHQNENTVQLSCSCTCDNTTSTPKNNNPTIPTNDITPTPLDINVNNPTPQPTNDNNPISQHTNDNNPTPQPTNDITPTTLDITDHNPTPIPTNKRNPIPLPTLGHNPAPLPTEENNPSTIPTNNNDPSHPSTNDNSLTPQTPSSTPQDGSTNQQLNNSFVYDNSLVTIPAAILSVIVLILVILLVGSFCYIVSLKRRLKGMKTYRMGDFSDMYMTYQNSVTGEAVMPAPRTHIAARGRNQNGATGHPAPYYNTEAVMPGSGGSMRGDADSLYQEVAGSREPVRPAVYLGLGQHNNN